MEDSRPIIALVGLKHVGKSTVGRELATLLGALFLDTDELLRDSFNAAYPTPLPTIREVYRTAGPEKFAQLEAEAVQAVVERTKRVNDSHTPVSVVVACGGGIIDNDAAWQILHARALVVLLDERVETIEERVFARGVPAFVDPTDPHGDFRRIMQGRLSRYRTNAHRVIDVHGMNPRRTAAEVAQLVKTGASGTTHQEDYNAR